MKKILLFITLLFLVVVFALPASASAATQAGVKPDSFFYFFDTAFEKVNLFFTFNPEKKARKALEYADERLAEIKAIAEEKNPDAIKTVITNYESNVALATEKSKEVKDKGQAESLLTSIADSTSKHQEILSDVLSKVPDEAKEAITKAIEASRKGQEEAAKQIAELKGEIEQLKKEVAELKAKEEINTKTSEELNNQKSKNTFTPTKPQTSPVSETAQTPKPTILPPPQTQTKVSEPQGTPLDIFAPEISIDKEESKNMEDSWPNCKYNPWKDLPLNQQQEIIQSYATRNGCPIPPAPRLDSIPPVSP